MHYLVWAIDPSGGQAVIRQDTSWYLVSIDAGWMPIKLRDEKEALGWVLSNSAISSNLDLPTMEAAISEIRTICLSQLDTPNTSFGDVIHLYPVADTIEDMKVLGGTYEDVPLNNPEFSRESTVDLPPAEWSVATLLHRCARRPSDEASWEEFVRRYHSIIRASVVKTFQRIAMREAERKPQFPSDLIDDLTQSVYIRLVEAESRALSTFEGKREDSIFEYLSRIAVNVVRDYFRELRAQKKPKINYTLFELLELTKDEEIIESTANRFDGLPLSSSSLTRDDVDRALRNAVVSKGWDGDQQILMFKYFYYDGLPVESIIKIMGLKTSKSNVNHILTSVSKRVKEHLAA